MSERSTTSARSLQRHQPYEMPSGKGKGREDRPPSPTGSYHSVRSNASRRTGRRISGILKSAGAQGKKLFGSSSNKTGNVVTTSQPTQDGEDSLFTKKSKKAGKFNSVEFFVCNECDETVAGHKQNAHVCHRDEEDYEYRHVPGAGLDIEEGPTTANTYFVAETKETGFDWASEPIEPSILAGSQEPQQTEAAAYATMIKDEKNDSRTQIAKPKPAELNIPSISEKDFEEDTEKENESDGSASDESDNEEDEEGDKTPPSNERVCTPPNIGTEYMEDVDKTPTTPRILAATTARVEELKEEEREDGNPFKEASPMKEAEFKEDVDMSRIATAQVADAVIGREESAEPPASPIGFNVPHRITEEERAYVHGLISELGRIYGRCSPHMAENPQVLATLGKNFIRNFLANDWSTVPVFGETTGNMVKRMINNQRKEDRQVRKDLKKEIDDLEKEHEELEKMEVDAPASTYKPPKGTKARAAWEQQKKKAEEPAKAPSPIKVGPPKPLGKPTQPKPKGDKPKENKGKDRAQAPSPSTAPATQAGKPISPKNGNATPQQASYANVAKKAGTQPQTQKRTGTASSPVLKPEHMRELMELKKVFPDITWEEAKELLPKADPLTPPKPQSQREKKAAQMNSSITKGPSRKAVVFNLNEDITAYSFNEMGKVVDEMNKRLIAIRSQVRVQNGRVYTKSVMFNLNKVPTNLESSGIKDILYKILKIEGEGEDPHAPQSIAHLIFKGFDYYTNKFNRRPEDILTGEQVLEAMEGCNQLCGLTCPRKPAVVKCKGSNDMAVVFLDVWDSKNGINTKHLVNKAFHMGGKLITVEYARPKPFVPQCQKCWRWNHGTSRCRINHQRCARCNQGHRTENHGQFGSCCGEERKKDTWMGVCSHKMKCLNCKGEHEANSQKCIFKRQQHNLGWHERRREADNEAERALRERRKANITQAIKSEIIEITDSA